MSTCRGSTTTASRYGINTTLRIREHQPPRPFDGAYGPSPRPPVDWHRWEDAWQIDRDDFAQANPPLKTSPPPGAAEYILTITGVKTLRDRGGAHVVTCFLDGDWAVEYIAKIYDGADYPLGSCQPGSLDCMSLAGRDYSTEAWAYRIIQDTSVLGGIVVPRYYGSWTFTVDTCLPGQPRRCVRMILMELIQGECMLDILVRAEDKSGRNVNYSLLPDEGFRLQVLQHILEGELAIWWEAAIRHDDIEPRNVIVGPDGSAVIVDFNQAYLYNFTARRNCPPKKQHPTRPPSPIEWYWPLPYGGFADSVEHQGVWGHWVPERWLRDPELAAEWLVKMYRNSPKFEPPSKWWLASNQHTNQSKKVLWLLESLGRKPAGTIGP